MGALVRDADNSESRRRIHHGHGRQLAVGFVKLDQLSNVDVGDAVAVGEQEKLLGQEPGGSLDAPTRHCVLCLFPRASPRSPVPGKRRDIATCCRPSRMVKSLFIAW